jgi:3-hydroxyacyl-[acyl-carrier-protein] dehydratase
MSRVSSQQFVPWRTASGATIWMSATDQSGSTVVLEGERLRTLLPHGPPFLFIDRVIELTPGIRGVALKLVTANDPILVGHFPGQPIMPGVLIVEACAQLAAIVLTASSMTGGAGGAVRAGIGYLASINRFKFLSLVVPGDCLRLHVRIGKRVGGLQQIQAEAQRGARELVGSGELAISLPS